MDTARSNSSNAALIALETAAASARSGFACMFSSSDEYETALITERRAQGRYDRAANPLADDAAVHRLLPDGGRLRRSLFS